MNESERKLIVTIDIEDAYKEMMEFVWEHKEYVKSYRRRVSIAKLIF